MLNRTKAKEIGYLIGIALGVCVSGATFANVQPVEWVPGQTSVVDGDLVSYNGSCFVAQNNPGVWDTPSHRHPGFGSYLIVLRAL